MVFITGFVVFTELSKRKIPVQHANKGGGLDGSRESFLPIKINSAGVIPVIFAASIMSAPSIIASFISADAAKAEWLKIFNYNDTFTMPWFNGTHWKMDWGLVIYLVLIIAFTFFYAEMEIDPETWRTTSRRTVLISRASARAKKPNVMSEKSLTASPSSVRWLLASSAASGDHSGLG
jgi:preprotein translocase subunit SecY